MLSSIREVTHIKIVKHRMILEANGLFCFCKKYVKDFFFKVGKLTTFFFDDRTILS
jgi:hypothetical protein